MSESLKREILKVLSNGEYYGFTELRLKVSKKAHIETFRRAICKLVTDSEIRQIRQYENVNKNINYRYAKMERSLLDELYAPMPTLKGEVSAECSIEDYHTKPALTLKHHQSYGVAPYGMMSE